MVTDLPLFISEVFHAEVTRDLREHARQVRRLFDAPGREYHDEEEPAQRRFKRWAWHNPPVLQELHHAPEMAARMSRIIGEPLKASYCFLSMYGRDGRCPRHTDRPQCYATLDYMIDSDAKEQLWPLQVWSHPDAGEEEPHQSVILAPGQAVIYRGSRMPHSRSTLSAASDATYANLAFFHFVPVTFAGPLS